ncbi:MAG TPA: AMP-binding protein [Amycolatopsis sp.]|nr:AMP-binding protein [Amycolatopsis sp.]
MRIGARSFGDRTAVADDGVRWSYASLDRKMLDAVRATIALGVRPGDRVALCGPNSARWIQAALGILGAGGILVPLNTRFKGAEYGHILRKSDPVSVITVGDFLGADRVRMMREAVPGHRALDAIVTLDDAAVEGTTTFSDFLGAGAVVAEDEAAARVDAVDGESLSDIMFTSGTTGAPKGVMLTHAQSLRLYGWLGEALTFGPEDTYLIVPPFFHTFGYKAGWLASLMHGVRVIPQRTFEVDEVLERIEKYRVSILLGPPTLFVDLINAPRRREFDLSTLRVSVPSAASVPAKLVHDMREILGIDIVITGYGLTEATSLVTLGAAEDDPEGVARTVGRAVPDVEVVVKDDTGHVLPPGRPGEVCVRGFSVMRGYWEDPAATAESVGADGFLHTGDIGVLDSDGFLAITDRMKDMFIVGGFNAYPAEIEAIIAGFDPVLHVAVVGAPDDRLGEVGVAFVVPKPGYSVTEDEVIAWGRENMANFKVPRRVILVDDLPRNASMKVLKNELRAMASSNQERNEKERTRMRVFTGVEDMKSAAGQEIGVTEWFPIAQHRIEQFADATDDHQWIHVDPERAKDGPYGTAIAHGYLTLSLLAPLMKTLYRIEGVKMAVNYGLNKVRFPAPVLSGSNIRVKVSLTSVDEVDGGVQAIWRAVIEQEGADKPACVAEPITRHFL